jgi:PAS domain S-box-containing protein
VRATRSPLDQRRAGPVLVLAPHGRDASVVCRVLGEAGFQPEACGGVDEVCRGIREGVGAVVLTEEALTAAGRERLSRTLALEPPWSDIPLLVLLARGRTGLGAWNVARGLDGRASPKLLGRPLHVATLVSAVDAALRARRRQHQVRDELEARRAAEAALRESERRLALAERAGRVGVFDWDLTSGRVYWTPAMQELFGFEPAQKASYETWAGHVHKEDRTRLGGFFAEWIRAGKPSEQSWEYRYRRPNGSLGWMAAGAILVRDESGTPVRMIGTNVDVTALKDAEERLRALNATLEKQVAERTSLAERRARDLRRLAAQLEVVEHRERERLAGILHDELQQVLFAAKMRLSTVLARNEPALGRELAAVERLLDQSMIISRHLSQELSPRVLERGTLTEVLQWLGGWFGENHGLSVTVEARGKVPRLSKALRLFLFQAVRELLLNVVKHSGVKEARIAVSKRRGWLTIEVADGGQGFEPAAVDLDNPRSFGLFKIRERLTALDGRMDMEAVPDGGARVRLLVPLPLPPATNRRKSRRSVGGG